MDLYYKQEVSVGLLVIVAAVIFIVGLMWLSGTPLGSGGRSELQIQFENVGGLAKGDPVLVSGFNVGRVSEVEFLGVGQVLVTIELREDIPPHADATASVGALDFLGSMKIEYAPGVSANMLLEGEVLTGTRQTGLTDGIPELKDQASAVMMGLQGVVAPETAENLNATLLSIRVALDRMTRVIDGQAGGPSVASTLASLQGVAGRLDSLMANSSLSESMTQLSEVLESIREMLDGLEGTTARLGSIAAKIDSGSGTVAMALNDSTLHHDMHELMTAITELVDDMRERPGRYFRLKVF
jgi:phospholipid/cholesterol/gamma-HCH transport system substrate-binding protein